MFTDRGNMVESSLIVMDVKRDWMMFIMKESYSDRCTVLYNCEKCSQERLRVSW